MSIRHTSGRSWRTSWTPGRPTQLGWAQRWGWRLSVSATLVMCLGQFIVYWLGAVDGGYLVVLLALLVGIVGRVLLGVGLVRARFRPRHAAWVLLLELRLMIALPSVSKTTR
ncbi:hypothetical protein [Nocardioides campestrisoli]|uniref:hypothetical protein n=1 Tax=Nocardioides campestrisoli TaxID=2736757 RepID=UPI00163D89BF|nr:hypothetical protein [Nocardioides campestrisoli]